MDKIRTIMLLCILAKEVSERKFKNNVSHDCFCGLGCMSESNFNMDEKVISFIETAVREKLAKETMSNNSL